MRQNPLDPVDAIICSSCDRGVARLEAWVQCPACLAVPICINCAKPFTGTDRRILYLAVGEEVGPFCARCEAVLTRASRVCERPVRAGMRVSAATLYAAASRLREVLLDAGMVTPAVADDLEVLAQVTAALTPASDAGGRS